MRAVNLLPKDAGGAKSIRREDPAVLVGTILAAIVLLALLAGFLNVHSKVNGEQRKLDAARAEYAELSAKAQDTPAPAAPVKTTPIIPSPSVTSEEQPRLTAVSSALGSRIAWDRILREFSLVLPSDVTISSLSLTAPNPTAATTGAPGAAPTGFQIQGTAYSHDGVARLLSRMMLIPDLSDVTLGSSTADTNGGNVQFSISAGIKGIVAPPPAAVVQTAPATTDTTGSSQ
jgi:hypothetical protein